MNSTDIDVTTGPALSPDGYQLVTMLILATRALICSGGIVMNVGLVYVTAVNK